MSSEEEKGTGFVCNACLADYEGIDVENMTVGYVGAGDFLCIRRSCCLAPNVDNRGLGMTTNEDAGEICKVGLYVMDIGIIIPDKICAGAEQCLCCFAVYSCPCSKHYVKEPVFACCAFQCYPNTGCMQPPPKCNALDDLRKGNIIFPATETMERE